MKDRAYTEIICKSYCTYYKGDKEDLRCGTYLFLERHLTAAELRILLPSLRPSTESDFSQDDDMKKLVCERCDLLIDGCDFREDRSGPPCGGYALIERLLP